jgi:hypothetical protein
VLHANRKPQFSTRRIVLKPLTEVPTASEALRLIADGNMDSNDYLQLCVAAIDEHEDRVGAFASVDRSPVANGLSVQLECGVCLVFEQAAGE